MCYILIINTHTQVRVRSTSIKFRKKGAKNQKSFKPALSKLIKINLMHTFYYSGS